VTAIEVRCSVCAGLAARFEAREGELERTGWFGSCLRPMPTVHAEHWIERIRTEVLVDLLREDPDFFAFVCRACAVVYCEKCWSVGPPEFDDGFYDCTRGECPKGHAQMLDD
jgi:hypothetical protein